MNVTKAEYYFSQIEKHTGKDIVEEKLIETAWKVRNKILEEAGGDVNKFKVVHHIAWKPEYSQVFYGGQHIGHLNENWINGVFIFEPVL